MAQRVAERELCQTCGVDVREGSTFCYNCGNPVHGDLRVPAGAREDGRVPDTAPLQVRDNNHSKGPHPELRPASAVRRQTERLERKPVEVMWVEPEGQSPLFYIVTLVLCGAALLLLIIALYLK